MQIDKMNKKELKDYINQNGFFFHMQCDKLADYNALLNNNELGMTRTGKDIPEGESIVVFKGIASQNYAKGEKSRNGYKYDQNGWQFEDYFKNPVILWQHDNTYGGIGHSVGFWKDKEGNLNIMFYVDLDTLEGKSRVQVDRGFVTAISTGAIPLETMFEDIETGEMLTEEEAETKYGDSNVWRAYWGNSDYLILVVTKADMLENSLVTIGSNEGAMASKNHLISITDGIGSYFGTYADKYKEKHPNIDEIEEKEPKNEEKEHETENIELTEEKPVETIESEEENKENEINEEEKEKVLENEEKPEDLEENSENETKEDEEVEIIEENEEQEAQPNNDNQNNDFIKILDGKMSDFNKNINEYEIKLKDNFEKMKVDLIDELKKDYISNEIFIEREKDLKDSLEKSFNDGIESLKKELTDKVSELEETDGALVDTINELTNKLKSTIFDSVGQYKPEPKQNSSKLTKLLETIQ